ncbi:MAG: hypothetical protein ABR875_01765 [Minisyncoccia bacterium]|jgi:hypothetical protein
MKKEIEVRNFSDMANVLHNLVGVNELYLIEMHMLKKGCIENCISCLKKWSNLIYSGMKLEITVNGKKRLLPKEPFITVISIPPDLHFELQSEENGKYYVLTHYI